MLTTRLHGILGAPVANTEACCHSAPFDDENSIDKVGDVKDVGLCNHGGNALLLRFRRILRMRRASTMSSRGRIEKELATADEVIEYLPNRRMSASGTKRTFLD
jgi:hypothetical protein